MAFYKNVASQKIPVYAFDSDTGLAATGEAANISAEISKDGGASAATNDAAPAELDATDHPGWYLFDMTQTEMNADMIIISPACSSDGIVLHPVALSTIPGSNAGVLSDLVDAPNATAVTAIQNGLATAAALATVDGIVDSILVDSAEIGAAGAGLTALPWNAAWDAEVQSEATDALNAYDPPTRSEATSDKAEILAETGPILSDTNELQTNQGNWLTATGFSVHSAADVWAVATRVLTANTNLNDPTAAAIVAALQAATVETGLTVNELFRVLFAACAGLSDTFSGADAATGAHFRNKADSKNRITVTTDANGNRTSITYDMT